MTETETRFELEMSVREQTKKYLHRWKDLIEFEDRAGTWQIVGMGVTQKTGKPPHKASVTFQQVAWWK